MTKKIPSANIKITSVLNTILNNPSGVISNNSVFNTRGLSSSIKVTGGVFGAPARSLSPIHHVSFQETSGGASLSIAFDDNFTPLDLVALLIQKPFSDSYSVSENSTIQFNKAKFDTIVASDSFIVNLIVNRSFSDTQFSYENIVFDFTKVLADTENILESITIDSTKVLADTQLGQTDSVALDFNKHLSDFVTTIDLAEIFDGSTYTLSKSLSDTYSGLDSISFATTKVLADSQEQSDLYTAQFTKVLADTQLGQTDSITLTLSINRNFADTEFPTDAIQSFNFNKVLADTALALDLLEVFDGSTYVFSKSLVDIQLGQTDSLSRTVDYNRTFTDNEYPSDAIQTIDTNKVLTDSQAQSDSVALDTNKVLADIQLGQEDSLSRTVDYNRTFSDEQFQADTIQTIDFIKALADAEYPTDAIQSFSFNKVLADTVIPEDLSSVFDGSNFEFSKYHNDYQYIEDSFSRTVDYNVPLSDSQSTTDKEYRKFDKAGVSDATRKWIAEGPSFHGGVDYAEDYFAITYDPIYGMYDEYTLVMGPTLDFTKSITGDSVSTSDSLTYVSSFSRTLSDTQYVTENKAIDFSKSGISDSQSQREGPFNGDENDFAPSYFADDYTELNGPIKYFIKALKEAPTVPDHYEYSLLKPLTESITVLEQYSPHLTKPFTEVITTSDHFVEYRLYKALADSVTTIDLIDINDGSLYELDKVFTENQPIAELYASHFTKGTFTEVMTASDSKALIDYHFAKFESVLGNDNGLPIDEEYYSIGYFPDTYIEDFKAGVIKTFNKSISDIVTVLDEATAALDSLPMDPEFANITDANTYAFIKAVSDTYSASDTYSLSVDKPIAPEYSMPLEGPGETASDGYARLYVASEYTLKRRPIWSLHKPFSDSVTDPDHYEYSLLKPLHDTQLGQVDQIQTIEFIKRLADTATPLDLLEVFDGSTYIFSKSLADTPVASNGLPVFNVSTVLPNDPAYALEHFTHQFTKMLYDTQLGQVDSKYIDFTKSREDSVSASAEITAKFFTKALADFVTVLDFAIAGLDNLPMDPEFQYILDHTEYSFNKVLADTAATFDLIDIDDGSLYSLNKVFADSDTPREGPSLNYEDEYSPSYFADNYTEFFGPIKDFIKAVSDSIINPDHTEYSLLKPLSDIQLVSESKAIDFTKAASDSVEPTDDITEYTLFKVLADTALALDLLEVFDGSTYTFAKSLADIQVIAETKAIDLTKGTFTEFVYQSDDDTIQFIKARSDVAHGDDNGLPIDEEYYAINYFPDTYIEDFKAGVVKTFAKSLSDLVTVLDEAQAGLTNYPLDPEFANITDDSIYSFIKRLADTPDVSDTTALSVDKPLTPEYSMPLEGPGETAADGYARQYVVSTYTLKRRPIWSLHKPFSDSVSESTHTQYEMLKPLSSTQLGQIDTYEIDINKVLADSVTPLDNINIFDGSEYQFNKTLADTPFATDHITSFNISTVLPNDNAPALEHFTHQFTKMLYDTATTADLIDINDGSLYDLTKAFADTVSQSDGITGKIFTKGLSDFVTVLDVSQQGIVSFPMDPEYPTASDNTIYSFIKSRADTQFVTDDITEYTLIKPIADSQSQFEGPAYHDEGDYSISYFADNYTEFFGPIISFIKSRADSVTEPDHYKYSLLKPLTEIINTSDNDTIYLTKSFSDSITALDNIGIFDGLNYTYGKTLADTNSLTDHRSWNFNKVLPGLVTSSLEVSQLYVRIDRTDITVDKTSISYETTTDPVYATEHLAHDFTKMLYDTATVLDLIDINDGSLYNLNKAFADSITVTDDISTFYIIKAFADTATAEDYLDIFDGSTYTFSKSLTDSQLLSDNTTFNNTLAKADYVTALDDGDQAVYSLTKTLTDTVIAPVGPSYRDEAWYSPTFFADDYTEFFGPIINFTKSRSDSVTQSDDQTFEVMLAKADSVTSSEDIQQFTITKVLSDIATALDYVGIFDGSTYTFAKTLADTNSTSDSYSRIISFIRSFNDSVTSLEDIQQFTVLKDLNDTVDSSESRSLDMTKPLSDSVTALEDIEYFYVTKVLADTETPTDDIQQFTVSKVLSDTASAVDLVGIFDGSTYEFIKTLSDTISTPTDSFSRSVAFERTVIEIASASAGTPVFNLNVSLADTVTASEFIDIASTAPTEILPTDTPSVDDAGSLRMSDYFEDLSYFEGVYIGQERTFT